MEEPGWRRWGMKTSGQHVDRGSLSKARGQTEIV